MIRHLGRVDWLYYWYQGTRIREQGPKGTKDQGAKEELA